MFCRKCGQELPDDAVFCVKCGTTPTGEGVPETKPAVSTPKNYKPFMIAIFD